MADIGTDPSELHDRLKAVAGGRTYKALADMTGQSPETVRRYMNGQAPSVEFLTALCNACGVNGAWMLTGRGPMRNEQVRRAALKEATAAELLSAMARTIELLTGRVERLEVFVQTLETRLRVQKKTAPDHERAPEEHRTAPAPVVRARSIADAVADGSRQADR